jgi:fused signal recognition particle receptor
VTALIVLVVVLVLVGAAVLAFRPGRKAKDAAVGSTTTASSDFFDADAGTTLAEPDEIDLEVNEGALDEETFEEVIAGEEALLAEERESREPPAYRERLSRSRGLFSSLRGRLGSTKIDEDVLGELEASLLSADVGVGTTDHVMDAVRSKAAAGELDDVGGLLGAVRAELLALLALDVDGNEVDRSLARSAPAGRVPVWLFVGVNGVGKTTTIGKLATAEAAEGRRVLLAAGDTFRAAAGDQLALWSERSGAEIVKGDEGGDPSAVVFDAIQRAGARKVDLVLADTAGRLHTKVNLLEELKKVRRVADREPGSVTEVLLVLDATTGQNAVVQARQFSDAVGATGVVLTKLDGTARGGVVVAIGRELGLPVKLVGLGEGPGDLVPFDAEAFIDALLEP